MATNINDLPSETSENTNPVQSTGNPPTTLSKDDVNKIISGLQQASQSNLTALPSRDIPMDNTPLTMDEQSSNPNYVPRPQYQEDYIQNNERFDTMIKKQQEEDKKERASEELFEKMQIPLLVSLLFLIFQMPFVRKHLFHYIPSLFLKDGNLSFGGMIFKSLLFGIVYYGSIMGMNYLSDM